MHVAEFEKDVNSNHHIAFITSTSNLRAQSYTIPTISFEETKRIAGRIIPAIATTTAAVVGLSGLELIKVVQSKTLSSYKNAFINLALPFTCFSDPISPAVRSSDSKEAKLKGFTQWDHIEIEHGRTITLKDFIKTVETTTGLSVSMVTAGVTMLFMDLWAAPKRNPKLASPLAQLVSECTKTTFSEGQRWFMLDCSCQDSAGVDIDIPTCRVALD